MAMLSQNNQKPFQAKVQLSQDEVTAYIVSALGRRDFSNVKVTYKYNENNSQWDRFASPILTAELTGSKNGKQESETISSQQIVETLKTELLADGHNLANGGVGISYSNMDRKISGYIVLLVPRKS